MNDIIIKLLPLFTKCLQKSGKNIEIIKNLVSNSVLKIQSETAFLLVLHEKKNRN